MNTQTVYYAIDSQGRRERLPSSDLMSAKKTTKKRGYGRLVKQEKIWKKHGGGLCPVGFVETFYFRGKKQWHNDENSTPIDHSFNDLMSIFKQLA